MPGQQIRIKYIVPFALSAEGVARRAAQVPPGLLRDETVVECVAVRNDPGDGLSPYEAALFDMYITEAGLRSEEEGYDAVVMDTVSDSGLAELRSRLAIPVVGPGQAAFAIATLLGRTFSIVTYSDRHAFLYEKSLHASGCEERCVSIRASGVVPDYDKLFGANAEHHFQRFVATANAAIAQDGAQVIVLGSTTMHAAAQYMAERLPVPVVDPGPVALLIAEGLVVLNLSHSKSAFAAPGRVQDDKWFSLVGADAGSTSDGSANNVD